MAKVTGDTIIIDALKMDPGCAPIFFKNGMHCIGCPSASGESIKDACAAHGIESEGLITELNEFFASKEA